MNRRVKAFVLVLALALTLALSTTAMAADIKISANVSVSGSSHSVTAPAGTYPSASGTFYFVNIEEDYNSTLIVRGSSYSSYWTGSATAEPEWAGYKATTTYKGVTVTDTI